MIKDLVAKIKTIDIEAMTILSEAIRAPDFVPTMEADGPDYFHHLLMIAKGKNWLHYKQLATAVGVSPSQVHRWFKPPGDEYSEGRSTPDKFTRAAVVLAVADIIDARITATAAELAEDGFAPVRPIAGARQKAPANQRTITGS